VEKFFTIFRFHNCEQITRVPGITHINEVIIRDIKSRVVAATMQIILINTCGRVHKFSTSRKRNVIIEMTITYRSLTLINLFQTFVMLIVRFTSANE